MNRLILLILCLRIVDLKLAEGEETEKNTTNIDKKPTTPLRRPNKLGPSVWAAGVHCLNEAARAFFIDDLDKVYTSNLIVTQARNLSTPAAQIQEGYLKLVHKIITEEVLSQRKNSTQNTYQLRVVSDAPTFNPSELQLEVRLGDYYVLVGDNADNLHKLIMKYLREMPSWNPGGKFLIMYHNKDNQKRPHETAMEIFGNMLSGTFVTRIILMYAVSPTAYHLFAMRYYTPNACQVLRAEKFGQCNNGRLNPPKTAIRQELHKMFNELNPQNCSFVLCASVMAPFVEHGCKNGLEIKMIQFFSRHLKFKVSIGS